MKVGVLTSSRADFGIYLPLLRRMRSDGYFSLHIIAFGTHLSHDHGFTIQEIMREQFHNVHRVEVPITGDRPEDIALIHGRTVQEFALFWSAHEFDLVLCLGDRFEMNGAVQAGIPFGVTFAHFHGGETTLGAIDNIYRHQISLCSKLHFCACEPFAERVASLMGDSEGVHVVGALGLAHLDTFIPTPFPEWTDEFRLSGLAPGFLLMTVHPETVEWQANKTYAEEVRQAVMKAGPTWQWVISMPNADTAGSIYRDMFNDLQRNADGRVYLVESFGSQGYLSAMSHAFALVGNTSSGIVEAASFGCRVLNLGNRQRGRLQSENTLDVPFDHVSILAAIGHIEAMGRYDGQNVYHRNGSVNLIIEALKNHA